MKKLAALLLFVVLAVPTLLLATPLVVPDAIKTAIGSQGLPTADLSMAARGDLNKDGLDDWVVVVSFPDKDRANASDVRILVFFARKHGGYDVAARSGVRPVPMRGEDPSGIDVKNGSLFIDSGGSTCCDAEGDRLQYHWRNEHMVLIGMKTDLSSTRSEADNDADPNYKGDRTIDTNFLTGERTVDTTFKGKSTRVTMRLPVKPLQLFGKWPYVEVTLP